MTVKGGTSQACAACKYQRRKCAADCQLAPHFPPDQQRQFQNAHRLFGVSNILKILGKIDPSQKSEAMRSMVYEANIRDRYPVHGCLGIIYTLCFQIEQTRRELEEYNHQIAFFRQQYQHHHHHHHLSSPPSSPSAASVLPSSQLQLAVPTNTTNNNSNNNYDCNNNVMPLFFVNDHSNNYPAAVAALETTMMDISLTNNKKIERDGNNNTSNNHNVIPFWAQHEGTTNNFALAAPAMQSSYVVTSPPVAAAQECDEISPYFDNIDDQQSYIECKEPYESSSESSLKDTMQSMEHVSEDEFKSAAACFSLTSVN